MSKYTGTIALDLDGVLCDFAYRFASWCLKKGHISDGQFSKTDFSNYKFYEAWGWTDARFLLIQAVFAEAREFENVPMYNGVLDFIRDLRDLGLKVIVATYRPDEAQDDTWRWCWKNLGVAKHDVWFAQHKPDALKEPRGDEQSRPKPWFAIEDYIKHHAAYIENGTQCFLWDQEWTRNLGRKTWNSYDDVVGVIKRRLEMISNPSLEVNPDVVVTPVAEMKQIVKTMSQDWGTEVTITNDVTGGKKGIKPERMDLVPVYPLTELSRVYGFGASKYADRNWEKGYNWSLSYGALMRHLTQFWNGEDVDSETGCHHLASVAFHAFALMQFGVTHPELDDRPEVVK
jgi:hypothetical protein